MERPVNGAGPHAAVQAVAKAVLAELGPTLHLADTERAIVERCVDLMARRGITQTWYHACPALVLLGARSGVSRSGRDYVPDDREAVGLTNLVTVDLSPLRDGIWGDCARSFVIEEGRYTTRPLREDFRRGLEVESALHDALCTFATPRTTFEALFAFANEEIRRHGFENLDFRGNVGHSIESRLDARRYLEAGNAQTLGDAGLFTFEPHIRAAGSPWGFKHENIYTFGGDGRVVEV